MVMEDRKQIQALERVGTDALHIDGTPLPPNLPIDYRERFKALMARSSFIDDVFAWIANGGTLITLAETWGVRHSDISGFIAEHKELRERYDFALVVRGEWEVERCLQELRAIATVDIRQAYNDDGSLKNVRDMPPGVAAALQSVETDELFEGVGQDREQIGVTRKVKFWDKAKAIELFMKKHGLLVERVKVQHTTRLEDLIHPANAEIIDVDAQPEQKTSSEIQKGDGVSGVLKTESHSDPSHNF